MIGVLFSQAHGFAMTEIVSESQEQKASQAASQHSVQDSQPGSRSRRGGRGRQNPAPAPSRPAGRTSATPLAGAAGAVAPGPVWRATAALQARHFEDLLAAHPELDKDALKSALQQHTRSGRYLAAMASGQQRRHDLMASPWKPLCPSMCTTR
jgi:hypothetical protein